MMHVSFSQKWLGFIAVFCLAACSPWGAASSRKPSLLIIAVESLSFENASCLEDLSQGDMDGFQELCDSTLRFTHFYSSSPMSQSSLASLLTGVDSSEHKVFHNGPDGIPAPLVTLPEKALQAGYRTAFFSGGAPFLAKSGFQQGFEVFDDDFADEDQSYRAAEPLLERTFNWLKEQSPQPTLATVFLADLQFPFVRTFTDEKKERERSIAAQKQDVAEALGHFFRELKKNRLWENTYIVLVGLNGDAPTDRKSLLWRENLFRENVHVPLFIKTPQMKESRSVDFLLSMKDVGQLLRDSMEQSRSGVDLILQKLDEWKENPPTHLTVESYWPTWWMGLPPVVSLRTAEYLVLPQKRWQIYHSLVDKSEGAPLSESQIDREKMRWLRSKIDMSYDISPQKPDTYDFIKAFRTVKMTGTSQLAKNLYAKQPSPRAAAMLADEALRHSDWQWLSESTNPLFRYVASRNLQNTVAMTLTGSCERFFVEKPRENLSRRCRDPLFLSLLDWELHRQTADSSQWEKNFIRQFRSYMKAKQMAYINIYLELNWDVNAFSMLGPSLTELYLQLPEKSSLRKKVESYRVPLYSGFPSET
jgi:hypothetical protein